MPTYEYKCGKCGPFEIWQSIKDNALTACPTCGAKVERLLSANVGFVLKGAGFYQNDYKNTPNAPVRAEGPSKPESKPSGDGSAHSTSSGQAGSPKGGPSGPSGQGCGTCGGPDPCPSGN